MAKIVSDNTLAVRDGAEQALRRAALVIGSMVESDAAAACPVDTGLLRNSITHGLAGDHVMKFSYNDDAAKQHGNYGTGEIPSEPGNTITVCVGTNVEYAPFQELGTSRMAGRHFLANAMEGIRDTAQQVVERMLRSGN